MTKVVNFPTAKIEKKEEMPDRIEHEGIVFYDKELDALAQSWSNELMDQLCEAELFDEMYEFDDLVQGHMRDQAYLHETLKAVLYRANGLKHAFHLFVDEAIDIKEFDDGSFEAFWKPDDEEEVDKE